eukprot:UN04300
MIIANIIGIMEHYCMQMLSLTYPILALKKIAQYHSYSSDFKQMLHQICWNFIFVAVYVFN